MFDSMIRACRLRSALLALSLCTALAPLATRAQLPSLGEPGDLTLAAERRIGDQVARELYRDPDYIDDPVIGQYVQGIWDSLLAAARRRGDLTPELDERFAWRVLLGKDRSINAFALPGGWLGLHLGLVAVTGSRDELASVLAHELSHVTQRHISRLIAQEKKQGPLALGAMILGALAASKNPQAGGAVMAGGQALAAQNQLNFSRDMEREADRIGFGVLTGAGMRPQGFAAMFDKLERASRLNDNGAFPYLRTHPLTTERLADMQSRVSLAERTAPTPPDLEYSLIAARARVLSTVGPDDLGSLVRLADALPADAPAARQAPVIYAAALSAAKLRDLAVAQRLDARLGRLVAADPRAARLARLLSAELALLGNDATRAATLVKSSTTDRAEMLLAAQAATRTGQAPQAAQALQAWVAQHPSDATAWQLLASANTAQGQQLRALRAEAEAQAAGMDYNAALDRLRAAQDVARRGAAGADHIEASIIDTRARQLQSLVREQALER